MGLLPCRLICGGEQPWTHLLEMMDLSHGWTLMIRCVLMPDCFVFSTLRHICASYPFCQSISICLKLTALQHGSARDRGYTCSRKKSCVHWILLPQDVAISFAPYPASKDLQTRDALSHPEDIDELEHQEDSFSSAKMQNRRAPEFDSGMWMLKISRISISKAL